MTNEAAERLRRWLAVDGRYVDAHPMVDLLVDEALAAERKATVELIQEWIRDTPDYYWDPQGYEWLDRDALDAFLETFLRPVSDWPSKPWEKIQVSPKVRVGHKVAQ